MRMTRVHTALRIGLAWNSLAAFSSSRNFCIFSSFLAMELWSRASKEKGSGWVDFLATAGRETGISRSLSLLARVISRYLYIYISRYLDILITKYLDIQRMGYEGHYSLSFLASVISSNPDIQISRYPERLGYGGHYLSWLG